MVDVKVNSLAIDFGQKLFKLMHILHRIEANNRNQTYRESRVQKRTVTQKKPPTKNNRENCLRANILQNKGQPDTTKLTQA